MIKNKKFLFSTITALFISFLISDFSIKNLFLANSPKINPFFVRNINSKFEKNLAFLNNFKKNISMNFDREKNITFKQISQGVKAAETSEGTIVKIDSSKIDWLEYTFNINGKEIKIKVPKDQQPPSQEVVEALYK
jgi:hypothetical protein